MLRRTKEAVAPELPSKTEETIYCEMTAEQSKRYDELRQYYRASVLGKVRYFAKKALPELVRAV